MTSPRSKIVPVILSGGAGTRLWPLSRADLPKQLHALVGETSLLRQTAARVADADVFAPPVVVTAADTRFAVAEHMRQEGVRPEAIVLEPAARDTAAAVAVAAHLVARSGPADLLLVLPSDHLVADPAAFRHSVLAGRPAAESGRLVAFGIPPTRPETGFGYIARGDAVPNAPGVRSIDRFLEKPDVATAERLVADGYLWNAGLFLFRADEVLKEYERLAPEVSRAALAALNAATADLDFLRLGQAEFASAPAISIDRAIMERTNLAAVVPLECGWNDLGSWGSLWRQGEQDGRGNVIVGDVVAEDVSQCYLRSEVGLLAAFGVSGLVVVVTRDAVLVTERGRGAQLKLLISALEKGQREEVRASTEVHRPWGWFRRLELGDRHQVKLIRIKPGARISLQKHRHRAEHWVVVAGKARVTRNGDRIDLQANQSTYIPAGMKHRLENVGTEELKVIEVQTGEYLSEDDIERFVDEYGRA